jgi:hypothetical protein
MGFLARRKNTFEKKTRFQPGFAGSPGSRVNPIGQLGFAEFLLIPVFYLTWTSLAIGSSRSQTNSLGRSNFNNYGLYRCLGSIVVLG